MTTRTKNGQRAQAALNNVQARNKHDIADLQTIHDVLADADEAETAARVAVQIAAAQAEEAAELIKLGATEEAAEILGKISRLALDYEPEIKAAKSYGLIIPIGDGQAVLWLKEGKHAAIYAPNNARRKAAAAQATARLFQPRPVTKEEATAEAIAPNANGS